MSYEIRFDGGGLSGLVTLTVQDGQIAELNAGEAFGGAEYVLDREDEDGNQVWVPKK